MKFLKYLLPATLSLLIATNVGSQDLDLKGKATDKIEAFKEVKMNAYTREFTDRLSSYVKENFERNKYLDFSIDTQKYLKSHIYYSSYLH